ncbi:restriction endonuclease subunit S [Pseudoalteromonas sp. CuT4-3]|uniref:restriction endonuclease subunit S n=1 Tax=Pseudoalteromonas sp. CuT4-3 TaxID=3112573 RepID=UPI002D7A369F|nr:restriction endonuclease subunit S [Pseudoalteromonas sp. CuT 4-3]WRU72251.1 restriction endonuclease subunit S [Pseudoalteromonas sp. CuT 4-3]
MADTKAPNTSAEQLITEHLDIWTTAIEQKSSSGRGSSKKFSLHGIKKLRELILELAVRGKLVPQDPNDEPASVLLERIAAEKAQLVKDKKIKKPKAIDNKFVPDYLLPDNWEFAQLDRIAVFTGGFAFKSSQYVGDGTRVIRISDFDERGLKNENIVRYEYEPKLEPFLLAKNDLLMAMTGGTVGKSLLLKEVSEPLLVNQRVAGIRLLSEVEPRYLKYVLQTNLIQSVIEEAKNSTNDNISMGDIRGFIIPLPPTSHQQLLIDKIDELMGLCDALEAQTENSIAAHQTLVEVLLEALLKAPEQGATPEQTAEQFQQNWQRLSEHFDTLFTTTASIDTLKRTIIELSVVGSFSDSTHFQTNNLESEPLSKALYEIEESIRNKEGKLEKIKPITIVNQYKKAPTNWTQCLLCDVVISLDHKRVPVKKSERTKGNIPYYGANGPVGFIGEYLFDEELVLVVEDETFIGRVKPFSYLIKGESWVNNHVHVLKCTSVILPSFLNFLLSYYPFIPLTSGTTGRKKLTKNTLLQIPIIFPSLEEQQRIVAKVDELMALCDQLKARLTDAQTTKLHLTDAIVEQAL